MKVIATGIGYVANRLRNPGDIFEIDPKKVTDAAGKFCSWCVEATPQNIATVEEMRKAGALNPRAAAAALAANGPKRNSKREVIRDDSGDDLV